jgi:hypothetical protein
MADEGQQDTGTAEVAPATGEQLGDAGKAALDAERKARRDADRKARDLEARLKEFEDRDKSESQKAIERAEAAERELPTLRQSQVRLQFALDKVAELDSVEAIRAFVSIADRLRGDTAEELAADAETLLPKLLPSTDQSVRPAARRPVDALTGGASTAPVTDPGPGQPRIMSGLAEFMK